MTKHAKDNLVPRYVIPTKTYVVWNEYDVTEPQGPSSSGMMLYETFKELYKTNKLAGCVDESWVEVLYTIEAATSEEASAIMNLRMFGEPYIPMGKGSPCYKCKDFVVFPESSCVCANCGHLDEDIQNSYHKDYYKNFDNLVARGLDEDLD